MKSPATIWKSGLSDRSIFLFRFWVLGSTLVGSRQSGSVARERSRNAPATGDLVCAVLRPGNKGAASHIVPILKRVVEASGSGAGSRD